MRLGVCVYILRDDRVLFLQQQTPSGPGQLKVPMVILPDGIVMKQQALALVRSATGLTAPDLHSGGMIFFRQPGAPDANIAVWVFRDRDNGVPTHSDTEFHWLALSPNFAAEIPELDRLWLPHVRQRTYFKATVHLTADGRVDYSLIQPKLPNPNPP